MTPRVQLGTLVGQMLRTWDELDNDPMSAHVGFYPDPMPHVIRDMEAAGWTYQDLEAELKARGISSRYVYFSGLGMILDCARLQAHRNRRKVS